MHQVARITKDRKNYMVRHDLSKRISKVARSKNLSQSKFLEQAAEHYLRHLEWEEAEGEMAEAMQSTRKINKKLDRVWKKVENSPW